MPHSLAAALLLTTMAQAQLQESLQKALTAHKANLLPEALEHYLAVLSLNPQLPAIHNNVAAIQLAQIRRTTPTRSACGGRDPSSPLR